MTEDEIQIEVMTWARKRARGTDGMGEGDPRLHSLIHVPNGGLRSKSQAARLKLMGVRAGVSDLLLPVPVKCGGAGGGWYPGLWLELKAEKGRVSEEQTKWLAEMAGYGWVTGVAWSAQEAIKAIEGYLGSLDEKKAP